MIKGQRCLGCSCSRRVDVRTGLCSDCVGTAIEAIDHKAKLDVTMQAKFARFIRFSTVKCQKSTPTWWHKSLLDVKAKLKEFKKE
jgi:hypothetical protein